MIGRKMSREPCPTPPGRDLRASENVQQYYTQQRLISDTLSNVFVSNPNLLRGKRNMGTTGETC